VQRLLFLCTGNYYRSRYAEILFNWKAEEIELPWRAESRGLDPDPRNAGPMSRNTIAALVAQGIPVDAHLRMPIRATSEDFSAAKHIVAVKEAEHRPMIASQFPQWLETVEFWHVHDLDCAGPEEALPHLDREVEDLIARLQADSMKI
jgi:protein-tyrosine phosphatase